MSTGAQEKPVFPAVCVERCGGICCDPWWGIISYPVVKEGGLANLSGFRAEVLIGLKARLQRITGAYRTSEAPQRALFTSPEKYNVMIKDIRVSGNTLTISIIAMYAFRCGFLSGDKACLIHPSVLGRDIRPPHCGWLGSPEAGPGERGYCRVVHAACSGDDGAVFRAVEAEKLTSKRSLETGVATIEEAAERVAEGVRSWCEANAPEFLPRERPSTPGRNDPCWCGSGAKFKKCHGGR